MCTTRMVAAAALLLAVSPLAAQQPRALTLTRELLLDAETEDFARTGGVVVRKNGEMLVVVDPGTIRFYSAEGKRIGTFGRAGEGPGEFKGMVFGTKSDTIWIGDRQNSRITWLGEDRKLLRTERLPAGIQIDPKIPGNFPSMGSPVPSAIYPDGDMLFQVYKVLKDSSAPWLPESGQAVIRTTHTGVFKSRVAVLPSGSPQEMSISGQTGNTYWTRMLPLYASQYSVIARDGSRMVSLTQDNRDPVRANKLSSYQVVMVGQRGDTIYKKSMAYQPEAIRPGLMDSLISDPTTPPEYRAQAKSMNLPKSYAPVRYISLGDDGSLWISLRVTAGTNAKFLVLDPKGAVRGTVSLPPGTSVAASNGSKVWVWLNDADDLPSLARYRVN